MSRCPEGLHNFPGRYYAEGPHMEPTIPGYGPVTAILARDMPGATSMHRLQFSVSAQVGKTPRHEARLSCSSRRWSLLFPEGYWAAARHRLRDHS